MMRYYGISYAPQVIIQVYDHVNKQEDDQQIIQDALPPVVPPVNLQFTQDLNSILSLPPVRTIFIQCEVSF